MSKDGPDDPFQTQRRFAPRRALALLAVAVAALAVWSAPASAATGHPAAGHHLFRLFAPNSVWNHPLSPDARIDPALAAAGRRAARRGETRADRRHRTVDPDGQLQHAPLHREARDLPTREGGARRSRTRRGASGLQQAFSKVPISPNARPAAGSDGHMTVWQPSDRHAVGVLAGAQESNGPGTPAGAGR